MGDPIIRSLNGRAAALKSWALTDDRPARTQAARDARLRKFEQQVDPEGKLPPNERRQRAEQLRRAFMLTIAAKSAKARRRKA